MNDDEPIAKEVPTQTERENLRVEITCALEVGFVVKDMGVTVGAFSNAEEMCEWLKKELRAFDPPREELPPPIPVKSKRMWG